MVGGHDCDVGVFTQVGSDLADLFAHRHLLGLLPTEAGEVSDAVATHGYNDAWLVRGQLAEQPRHTGLNLCILWVPVIRRSALHHVADEVLCELLLGQAQVEQATCSTDKGKALFVFVLAGGFADEPQWKTRIPTAIDSMGPADAECAPLA